MQSLILERVQNWSYVLEMFTYSAVQEASMQPVWYETILLRIEIISWLIRELHAALHYTA